MTLAEVITAGPSGTKRFKSSAAGAYQFMNATLKGLAKEHDLKAHQIFNAKFQDWLRRSPREAAGCPRISVVRISVPARQPPDPLARDLGVRRRRR
jgi:hypothetical protein